VQHFFGTRDFRLPVELLVPCVSDSGVIKPNVSMNAILDSKRPGREVFATHESHDLEASLDLVMPDADVSHYSVVPVKFYRPANYGCEQSQLRINPTEGSLDSVEAAKVCVIVRWEYPIQV
jgi:hypothetical protein